jgi:hypothetical protein
MPVRCAWCGRELRDDARLTSESHGICSACQQVNFPEQASNAPPKPQ